jgi:hypothetical protein
MGCVAKVPATRALKMLEGDYIFADWSDDFGMGRSKLFAAKPPKGGNEWTMQEIEVATSPSGRVDSFILAFGQDEAGELYLMTSEFLGPTGLTGKIQKLVSAEAAKSEAA